MKACIDVPCGDSVLKFRKLTRRIRGRVEELARLWRKERLADSLGASGYDGEELLEQLNRFDETPVSGKELISFLNPPTGTDQALLEHLDDPEQRDLLDDLQSAEDVLCDLWGFTKTERTEAAEAEPEPPADPTVPLTFGK